VVPVVSNLMIRFNPKAASFPHFSRKLGSWRLVPLSEAVYTA
jgi:hypothetical protein